jgi:hypothetical protein
LYAVKITYERRTDTLSVVLKDGVAVAERDEEKPGAARCDANTRHQ